MKKIDFSKMKGIDRILCGIAGGGVGFLLGGIVPALLGVFAGGLIGHLLERDLKKIKN